MKQEKCNTYWTQSSTEKQKGKPSRYNIGYGSSRHGDGDSGKVCTIETDDKMVVDFIVAAPKVYQALLNVSDEIPVHPNVHGGEYMITLSQSEVDAIRSSLVSVQEEK